MASTFHVFPGSETIFTVRELVPLTRYDFKYSITVSCTCTTCSCSELCRSPFQIIDPQWKQPIFFSQKASGFRNSRLGVAGQSHFRHRPGGSCVNSKEWLTHLTPSTVAAFEGPSPQMFQRDSGNNLFFWAYEHII